MVREDLLFFGNELSTVMANTERKMNKEIDDYSANRLLNTSTDDLVKYFISNNNTEPIVIFEDEIVVDQSESKIDVSHDTSRFIMDRSRPFYITGTMVTFEVPFTGDAALFKCKPSRYNMNPPAARITGNVIKIIVQSLDHKPEIIKGEFTRCLVSIKEYVGWINMDLVPWCKELPGKARIRIEGRKSKLLKDQGLVSELGFPMKRRDDANLTYAAPQVRRKIEPRMPIASTAPYAPEPILEIAEYEHIISIIRATAGMLERSPQAFKGMEEEHLRDQFLVPLNTHYEGQATGETFNFNGKTDIMIKAEGKSIFIAECKIWRGQKALSEAIDQLLGYSTWRDTKLALIIFNRNKGLSGVISKIPETIKAHSNFKRELLYHGETGFRYILGHRDDRQREITLTVLVFEVPAQ